MKARLLLVALTLLVAGCASQAPSPATGNAAVATAHPAATEAALETLAAGGNAFDAAVTAAAVLGVAEPYSAGMGGGGFWLLRKHNGDAVVIDARETAPGKSHPDMYLDEDGEPLPDRPSLNGALAAGIPGQPAAFAHITSRYGQRSLADNLNAAIKAARDGVPVDERYQRLAGFRIEVMAQDAETRAIFLDGGDEAPSTGVLIRQPALADTMATLGKEGHEGFYQGAIAQALVDDVNAAGGIWTLEDLADYRIIEREPTRILYGDAEILTTPAPSSGGLALAQMFAMLDHNPAPDQGAARIHHLAEIMRRAYHDRAFYLGDPDYTDIPVAQLLDPAYLARQADSIDPDRATSSDDLRGHEDSGTHTTHLSVVDRDGNQVSATLSINYPFGAGVTSPATGILLNNEMDDFSIKPGEPNAYGLIGGAANQVEAGKRPLSSMTPAIMVTPEYTTVLGTPGGSRIITMNFLGLLMAADGMDPEAIVKASRFHHQYHPDQIQHEPDSLTDDEKKALRDKGHKLDDVGRQYGNMQVIRIDHRDNSLSAASDPRGVGSAKISD